MSFKKITRLIILQLILLILFIVPNVSFAFSRTFTNGEVGTVNIPQGVKEVTFTGTGGTGSYIPGGRYGNSTNYTQYFCYPPGPTPGGSTESGNGAGGGYTATCYNSDTWKPDYYHNDVNHGIVGQGGSNVLVSPGLTIWNNGAGWIWYGGVGLSNGDGRPIDKYGFGNEGGFSGVRTVNAGPYNAGYGGHSYNAGNGGGGAYAFTGSVLNPLVIIYLGGGSGGGYGGGGGGGYGGGAGDLTDFGVAAGGGGSYAAPGMSPPSVLGRSILLSDIGSPSQISLGSGLGGSANGWFVAGGSGTITISWVDPVAYTVTASAGTGGTISPATQTVISGNTTTFTVTPNTGYIAAASGCSGTLSGATYTTGAITSDCTVTATFTLDIPTVTITPAVTIPYGGSTTLTLGYSPNANFCRIFKWDGTSYSIPFDTGLATTFNLGALTSSSKYQYFCNNSAGAWSSPAYSVVTVASAPTLGITVSPTAYYSFVSSGSTGGVIAATYTLTNGTFADTQCQLLNWQGGVLTGYSPCTGTLSFVASPTPGPYGYSIRASKTSTGEIVQSAPNFTVNVTLASCIKTTILGQSCTTYAPAGSTVGSATVVLDSCTKAYAYVSGCSVPVVVTCGSAANTTSVTQPTSGLCSDGSTPAVLGTSSTWNWLCGSGNSAVSCSAPTGATPGTCGSANNTSVATAPTAPNLCNAGTATPVTGGGPWSWSCNGSNGGTTASCSASKTSVIKPKYQQF